MSKHHKNVARGNHASLTVLAAFLLMSLVSSHAHACARGCGVFDVGTSMMFPEGTGARYFWNITI